MRFLVSSNNERVNARVRETLARYPGHEAQFVPLVATTGRAGLPEADVLLVVLSPDPTPGLALLRAPHGSFRKVLAVGPVTDARLRLGALSDGADQYLDEAELDLELEVVLRRLGQSSAAPEEAGKVIAVLAPSGGSGSSTLAVNLATALAQHARNSLLLDLNLGAGDVAPLLDLKPAYTLADLCKNGSRPDRALLERCLVRHPSGVSLLAPTRSFSDIAQVTAQAVGDVLGLARGLFPYIIVDLDDSFHGEQTQTLRQSDVILLVLRLDFTSLRNTQRTLDHLAQLHIPRERVRVVVNRYGQPKELPSSRAEEVLGVKIAHYIPDDPKTINRANNNGVPAVLEAPSAKVSRSVLHLAQSVNGRKVH